MMLIDTSKCAACGAEPETWFGVEYKGDVFSARVCDACSEEIYAGRILAGVGVIFVAIPGSDTSSDTIKEG